MNTNERTPPPLPDVPRTASEASPALGNILVNEPSVRDSGVSVPLAPEETSKPQTWAAAFEEQQAKSKAKVERELRPARRYEARRLEERERDSKSHAQSEALERMRGLERLAATETGTRSPSTIPDRLPVSREPTSLRPVATSIPTHVPAAAQSPQRIAAEPVLEAAAPSSISGYVEMGEAQYSDHEEEESLLNDDFETQDQEYIVPLPIQGRQADNYRIRCTELHDLYTSRDQYRQDAQLKIENVLKELGFIETHIDLVRIGNSIPQPDDDQLQQDKHLVQWSCSNSIKFRFLEALLSTLQARDVHVILVIDDQNNSRLFSILESFLRGLNINFESPCTGQSSNAANEPNKERRPLKITILASTIARVLQEAHLIVSLDGITDVTKIRKNPWARKPDRSFVPVLQLVIPRTVSHIDRYLSTKLDAKRRLDTIVATLSQFVAQGSIGHAVDDVPPKSYEIGYARDIVQFLLPSQDESALSEWPLPPLGNIKDDIDYQSQESVDALQLASPLPTSNAVGKRPLIQDDDRIDPAKRMRLTPQPQSHTSTIHISGSEPRASISDEQRLEHYRQEMKRLHEIIESCLAQQWRHEEMNRNYKALETRAERAEKWAEVGKEREAKLREQLSAKNADNVELRKQNEELRGHNLLSEDANDRKIAEQSVEIEDLKDQLAKERKAKEDAVASKSSTETTLEYVQDERRKAQGEVIFATQRVEELTKTSEKLQRAAAAQPLLPNFLERQNRQAIGKEARLVNEDNIRKKQIRTLTEKVKQLTAENEHLKLTRGVGGGTRAASVGARTPRPGSRAASPLPNGRDRLSNLRNG